MRNSTDLLIIWAITCIMIHYLLAFSTLLFSWCLLLLALLNSFASPFGLDIIWWMYIDFIWNFTTKELFKLIPFINCSSRTAGVIFWRGSSRFDKVEYKKFIPCSEFLAIWMRSSNLLRESEIFFPDSHLHRIFRLFIQKVTFFITE